MSFMTIPTSKDIYIEVDGKKVAVVSAYSAKSQKQETLIEEFGSAVPVCAINGTMSHSLTLKRVYFIANGASDIDFYSLKNFSVVIVKPDKRILYTGCEWTSISESLKLNEACFEEITVSAANRIEG